MVNEVVLNYIKGNKGKFPMKDIRAKIVSRGYSNADVDEVVRILDKEKPVFPKKGDSPPKKIVYSPKKEKRVNFKEPVSRREHAFKWVKMAGIIGLVFFALMLLNFVLGLFDVNVLPIGTELWITYLNLAISLIVATAFCFYYFGFAKLGKFTNSKLLRVSSIVFMVFSVLFLLLFVVTSILTLFDLSSASFSSYQGTFWESSSPQAATTWDRVIGYVFLGLFLLTIVFRYLFAIGLMRIRKKVKFSLVAGIIGLIGIILITLITGFFIYVFLYPMEAISFLFGIGPKLLTIIKVIGYIFTSLVLGVLLFEALALLNGSKKFE